MVIMVKNLEKKKNYGIFGFNLLRKGRPVSMKNHLIAVTALVATIGAYAANLSYTPQGSAPYYWSNAAAWGGALPGSGDEAIANNLALLANPLIVASGTSPSVGTNRLGNCILQIEEGASLSMSSGYMLLAGVANQTSIVTNYGTVSVNDLQFGVYGGSGGTGKGKLAQFDNFGTLNIGTYFRIGIRGTRSIFYNHEGATFNKTGGGAWSFYMATDSGGDSTIINEGTMVCGSGTETWTGNSDSKNEIIMRKSGTFNPGPLLKIGHVGTSTTTINLYDNSKLLGSTLYRVGGTSGSKGYITLSNESSIVTSDSMYLGYEASTIGSLALADNATANLGYTIVGRGGSSKGILTLADNSCLVIGSGSEVVHFGYSDNSSGSLSLSGSAMADIRRPVYLGSGNTASGAISLAGNSQLFVTNYSMVVGYNNGSTGVLHIADNAVLHVPSLKIGQTSVAGTTGFATLSGNATLFSTNIVIPAWGDSGRGTLEVADNAVITNLQYLKVGLNGNANSQAVKMRGGSIYFDIDPTNPIYMERGYYDPLMLNENRTVVRGFIRGWGKIAFSDPRTYVTEAFNTNGVASPSGIVHYGQVIADGEGVMRDLDFSRFGALHYATTDANPSGTNGWFAVNKGRLKLPRSLPNRNGYKCVGDCFDANVDLGGTSRRLANTFNYAFAGAELNDFVFSELYATDRDDIPAGLNNLGADKVIAVWRIGYFSDGPEIDEPTHPSSFTSANLKFKYSPKGLDGLDGVYVYRHDGTANGTWVRTGKKAEPSTTMPIVATGNFAPSSETWNMGWFAIVGRTRPFGTAFSIR